MFELDSKRDTRYGVVRRGGGVWWSASLLWTRWYIMCRARYFYLCPFYKHIWIRVTCKGVEFEHRATDGQIFLCIFILTKFFLLLLALLFSSFLWPSSGVFAASKMDGTVVLVWMLGRRCCWLNIGCCYFLCTHIFMLCSSCAQYFLFFFFCVVVFGDGDGGGGRLWIHLRIWPSLLVHLALQIAIFASADSEEQYYWFL